MRENYFFIGESNIGKFRMNYYVTGSYEINDLSGFFEWGIRIEKYEKDLLTESEEIKNISPDYKRVADMTNILLRNSVTPSGLFYAVSDMVSLTCNHC